MSYINQQSQNSFESEESITEPFQYQQQKIYDGNEMFYQDNTIYPFSDTDSSEGTQYPSSSNGYNLQWLLFHMNNEIQIPSVLSVSTINGIKNGYGEIQFEGEYQNIVFSTQWINDICTNRGFVYNQSTNQVLGFIYSENDFHFFSEDDMPYYDVLDQENGERWEGYCYDNKPCGNGIYYNESNHIIYKGMCVNDCWEGYGISYLDLDTALYEGWWCHSQPMNKGTSYDRKGNLLASGLIVENHYIDSTSLYLQGICDLHETHCFLEELWIGNNTLNNLYSLNLDAFRRLRIFSVGNQSLQHCHSLIISHLPYLQTIAIGINSFSPLGNNLELLLSEMNNARKYNKTCIINDLPQLQFLSLDTGSFSDYCSLTITNVPSLTDLKIGTSGTLSCNFFFSSLLNISYLQSLQRIMLGDYSFYHTNLLIVNHLPLLQSLTIGNACFFRYINKSGRCVLSNLPCLNNLVLYDQSLVAISCLILSNISYTINNMNIEIGHCLWSLTDVVVKDSNVNTQLLHAF